MVGLVLLTKTSQTEPEVNLSDNSCSSNCRPQLLQQFVGSLSVSGVPAILLQATFH